MADTPTRIVIATGNPHKVAELRELLAHPGLEFVGLADLPGSDGFDEPEETGSTFEQNATIKALSYAEQTGLPCLADDSGLEVDALEGAPGVISSHYCTDGRETGMSRDERDKANNEKLLSELGETDERDARFVCVMVLAVPGGTGFQPVEPRPVPSDMSAINRRHRGRLIKTRGDLPHWHQNGATYFVTFRVAEGELSESERDAVLGSCLHWHDQRAIVHLVVVMPDHVHMLLSPLPAGRGGWHQLSDLMHSVKSFTATEINRSRGATGALWQPEYFDRLIRDADEFEEKWEYMLQNPVRAELASDWSQYRWTRGGMTEDLGRTQVHRLEAGATVIATVRGTFDGRVGKSGDVPRGEHGFGYDPLFLVRPDFDRTSAELEPVEKGKRSHRGAAARLMLGRLRSIAELAQPSQA